MKIQHSTKSHFTGLLDAIYMSEIQHPTKSHFTGLLDVICEYYYILQIFSIPYIIQKIFYCLIFNIYHFLTKI